MCIVKSFLKGTRKISTAERTLDDAAKRPCSVSMEMDVLRSLFRELGYPSADKLWAAARRKGLKDVTKSDAVAVVRSQNSRQVFAARPRYDGKVVANRLDDRWDADLIDYTATPSKSSDSVGKPYKYILIVQDVFFRRIWAVSLRENNQEVVTQAFEHIVRQAKDKPDELDTDQGPEFKGQFEDYLADERIAHVTTDLRNKNARGTLDAAIRSFKRQLALIQAEEKTRD